MSSQSSEPDHNHPQMKKRRRGESRTSRQTPRYQCYCSKVYLSYPALYLHLKNKHPECFLNNRKIQVTKFKQSITPDGFKILKMEKDPNEVKTQNYMESQMYKVKNIPPYPFTNYHPYAYSTPQNFMMPPMDSKPFFMDNSMNSVPMPKNLHPPMSQSMSSFNPMPQPVSKNFSELKLQSQAQVKVPIVPKQNILSLLETYISDKVSNEQLQIRQIMEVELLYSLLPKCIKQKSDMLRSWYNLPASEGEILNSTETKYLEGILGHFREVYCKNFVEKHKYGDENVLSKHEKSIRAMIKVNRYFCDMEMMTEELKRFQQWLIKREIIEKVQQNFPL